MGIIYLGSFNFPTKIWEDYIYVNLNQSLKRFLNLALLKITKVSNLGIQFIRYIYLCMEKGCSNCLKSGNSAFTPFTIKVLNQTLSITCKIQHLDKSLASAFNNCLRQNQGFLCISSLYKLLESKQIEISLHSNG